jgi:hypothetical protein
MAFTRFHDDPLRIQKQIDESTFSGRYMLNTPGQGINMPYQNESQLRLQKWGANITNNIIDLESDFLGLTRPLNRDLVDINNYKENAVNAIQLMYPSVDPFIEESRSSHPAWMYKDLEQPRWELPWINPQANLELKFPNNIQTRILEKDYYIAKIPNLGIIERSDYLFDDFKNKNK